MVAFLSVCQEVQAACRNPNIVEEDSPFLRPAAASGAIEIKWFGHSFFQITSSSGTKIITDPFGAMGFPYARGMAEYCDRGKGAWKS